MTKPLKLDDLAGAIERHAFRDGIDSTDAARAILTTIKEAGWKIVPVEASEAMLDEVDDEDEDKFVARGRAVSAWQAMIAAAPQIEGE